jgi:L-lactate dehydrogenase
MKISIIGVGRVGSALGLALVARHLVDELVLVGRRRDSARGEAMDLLHATAFGKMTTVRSGDLKDTAGSDIIVICFAPRGVGRERAAGADLNFATLKHAVPLLVASSPNAVFLVATNPVDAMTTLVGRLSGLPPARVIGTGTLLDTMRLRILLSERCGIVPRDIRAYVLGEHGDSQFAAFSSASAGGGRLAIDPAELRRIEADVRRSGHEIAKCKGYTNHGIALATTEIIEAIVRDSREIMPLSVLVEGFHGVKGVCLSLPVVVGREGAMKRIEVELSCEEIGSFRRSAEMVRRTINSASHQYEAPHESPQWAEGERALQPAVRADYCI